MSLLGAKILVTGGMGFLGRHVVRTLADRGAAPVALGRRPSPGGIAGDVTDADALRAAVAGMWAVIHLAASPGHRAADDPVHDATVNAIGTLNVLRAAQAHGARVIYASTSHVYGPSGGTVAEDSPTRPASLYGASKLAGEIYCGMFRRAHGLPVTVLRFGALFGTPVSGPPPPNVVEVFTARALAHEPLALHGGPDVSVDVLDVTDAATAVALALEAASGGTYNIGGGEAPSLGQLAECVVRETGSRSELRTERTPSWGALPVLDTTRAARMLSFDPGAPPLETVARYARWRTAVHARRDDPEGSSAR